MNLLNSLVGVVLDIFFPRRCPVCGDIVVPKSCKACDSCKDQLQLVKEPCCKKCSKPIEQEEAEYCFDCSNKKFHYEKGFALWIYDKRMKKSIGDFKYKGRREYVSFYAEEFIKYYGDVLKQLAPDALIPIPLHKAKLRTRGYNQAELLARAIGDQLQIPVINHVLIRNKKTLPQKELNDKERLKNLLEAFEICEDNHRKLSYMKRIILVDDIYTTGSTIEACTNVLKQAGVEEVFFISLCIGKGF